MADRDLRIVGPERHGSREAPVAPTAGSAVEVIAEPVLSLPASDVLLRIGGTQGAATGLAGSAVDPNTGEPIVLPAPQARPRPATIGRPTTRRSGRMREYLRLVEGA